MENIELKLQDGTGFETEFEIAVTPQSEVSLYDAEIAKIDEKLGLCNTRMEYLNTEIDRLTNHADGLDYTVAVASGILCGLIDSFFVGEFSLENANKMGSDKVNDFVKKVAKSQGCKEDDLESSIRFLEKKFPIAADKATTGFGGGLQHHLRDFSHQPTPVGLIFSLMTQFTGKVYGTDVAGVFKIVQLSEADMVLVGKNFPEKIVFGVIHWFFHMVSDMAGSSSTPGAGTGLPGPVVALLKEISAIPIFKKTNDKGQKEFSVWISKLFNGTLLKDASGNPIKFDLRTEIGIGMEIGKQAIPVLINECIVRGFYFIRRFIEELKRVKISSFSDLKKLDAKKFLPFKNRTIVRMLTIATGTFVVVDMADAAIRSAVKSVGNPAAFAGGFLLRINFVGIGRFAIAVVTDIKMGIQRNKLVNERLYVYNEMLALTCTKLCYRTAEMWDSSEKMYDKESEMWQTCAELEDSVKESIELMEHCFICFGDHFDETKKELLKIKGYIPEIEEKNPGLLDEIFGEPEL